MGVVRGVGGVRGWGDMCGGLVGGEARVARGSLRVGLGAGVDDARLHS